MPSIRVTIRGSLIAISALLAASVVMLTAQSALEAWRLMSESRLVETNNRTADLLLDSASIWAQERGITNAALASDEPVTAERRAAIDQRRDAAARAFEGALTALEREPDFAGKGGLIQSVKGSYQQVVALRARVDTALAAPKGQRDADTMRSWVPTMTALIMASQHLRQVGQFRPETIESQIQQLRDLKQFLWVMSEFAGRERATLGGLIDSASVITPEALERLANFRGQLEQAWSQVESYVESDNGSPVIKEEVKAVKAKFFDAYQGLREGVYRAGLAAQPYPVDGSQWIAESTAAIDTLTALAATASGVAADFAARSASQGQWQFGFNLALLSFGVVTGVLAFWVAVWRVGKPVQAMTTAMTRLAQGDLAVEIPGIARKDEVGEMAQAVQVFKDNAIETERLRKEQEAAELRAQEEKRQAMNDLAEKFSADVGAVVEAVTSASAQLETTAQSMSAIAEQTSQQSGAVATAAQQSAANVQTVAAATEELSGSSREIGTQVAESANVTRSAVDEVSK
ncbi:MAG: HAMP domain-containing protein, partial [Bacteroidota bacterium]|nr:methyl-accepting chemotaxis protein [Kiloniellaceae bacterium]